MQTLPYYWTCAAINKVFALKLRIPTEITCSFPIKPSPEDGRQSEFKGATRVGVSKRPSISHSQSSKSARLVMCNGLNQFGEPPTDLSLRKLSRVTPHELQFLLNQLKYRQRSMFGNWKKSPLTEYS